MEAAVTILSLGIALSIVVFVHELGHLLVAKRSKVVVEEFGFGYPPRLIGFWRGEGRIVLGKDEMVIPRKFNLPEELRVRSLVAYEASSDRRGRQVISQLKVVAPDEPEAAAAKSVEFLDPGTLYSINAIPFGGFARMLGEEDPSFPGSLASKRKITRILVLAAGAAANLLTAVLFFAFALALGAPALADPPNTVVGAVSAGSPAETAGLQSGDLIVQADGRDVATIAELQAYIQDHLGTPVTLTVQRDSGTVQITVVPRVSPPEGEGPTGISLTSRMTLKQYPWYQAIWMALKETIAYIGLVVTIPIQVLRGLVPADLARPVGPVGVGRLVGDAVQYSLRSGWWFPVMQLMGTLSVALAVTNLLPLPALDGGRILFVILEGIRGRRVDPAKEGLVHLIGMLLLVGLMLVITWQDVVNPIPSFDWSSLF